MQSQVPIIDQKLSGSKFLYDLQKIQCLSIFFGIVAVSLPVTFMQISIIDMNLKDFKLFKVEFTSIIIKTVLVLGLSLGGLFSGFVSNKIGRFLSIKLSFIIMDIILVIMISKPQFIVTATCVVFGGISYGLTVPLMVNAVIEILPMKNRGLVLNLIWCGYTLTTLANSFLISFNMTYGSEGFSNSLIILGISSLIFQYLALKKFRESPRILIVKGRSEDGIEYLQQIFQGKVEIREKIMALSQTIQGENMRARKMGFYFLFKNNTETAKHSFLLILIWIQLVMSYCGLMSIFSEDIQTNLIPHDENDKNFLLKSRFYLTIITVIANVVIGYISDLDNIGRIKTLMGSSILLLTLTFSCIMIDNSFLLMALHGILEASLNVLYTYTSELYPTIFRDIALGFMTFVGRFGNTLAFLVFYGIFFSYDLLPFYLLFFTLLIICFSIWFLDINTNGSPLDGFLLQGDEGSVEMDLVSSL